MSISEYLLAFCRFKLVSFFSVAETDFCQQKPNPVYTSCAAHSVRLRWTHFSQSHITQSYIRSMRRLTDGRVGTGAGFGYVLRAFCLSAEYEMHDS